MGDDEAALLRLWREKRGEIEPEDLSAITAPTDGRVRFIPTIRLAISIERVKPL
jgi:hypothetical protein